MLVTGPDKGGAAAWWFTAFAVWIQGGHPIRSTPKRVTPEAWDALVLGGGADIDPRRFGQELGKLGEQHRRAGLLSRMVAICVLTLRKLLGLASSRHRLDPARDAAETRLLHQAWSRGAPVLGICRGAQLINVFFRGSLYTDLADFYRERANARSVLPTKLVRIGEGSTMQRIVGTDRLRINALHDQAMAEIGSGLVVSACEPNGVVQAIESLDPAWPALGVQWHPEYLPQRAEQRRLFAWLVEAARAPASRPASSASPPSARLQPTPAE
ncbi:MAG: gamma-glutamyl-gamma-aminobutyrate hydrolase family protein [Polyangiaceae bacterium]|nr:gamma-glutamyl-gamma-aminobutyrate hydrolase family protein [Polyangiaceae bacterium]